MINKPLLTNAIRIPLDDNNIPESVLSFLSPNVRKALEEGKGYRSMPGEDPIINETFVLKEHRYGSYHYYIVKGSRTEFSLYRLVGGCNHLFAFGISGCEKSEDYDSIPSSKFLDLPQDFDEAIDVIDKKYLGKKLRIVARSAANSDGYGRRYLLFAVED